MIWELSIVFFCFYISHKWSDAFTQNQQDRTSLKIISELSSCILTWGKFVFCIQPMGIQHLGALLKDVELHWWDAALSFPHPPLRTGQGLNSPIPYSWYPTDALLEHSAVIYFVLGGGLVSCVYWETLVYGMLLGSTVHEQLIHNQGGVAWGFPCTHVQQRMRTVTTPCILFAQRLVVIQGYPEVKRHTGITQVKRRSKLYRFTIYIYVGRFVCVWLAF